jgi:hypothetical protein
VTVDTITDEHSLGVRRLRASPHYGHSEQVPCLLYQARFARRHHGRLRIAELRLDVAKGCTINQRCPVQTCVSARFGSSKANQPKYIG